jgi:hypothetical protein
VWTTTGSTATRTGSADAPDATASSPTANAPKESLRLPTDTPNVCLDPEGTRKSAKLLTVFHERVKQNRRSAEIRQHPSMLDEIGRHSMQMHETGWAGT